MDVYKTLQETLDTHPSGAPASPTFEEILRILFNEHEARLAVCMSFSSMSVERIADAASVDVLVARERLEAMADRGVVFSRGPAHAREFGLVPTVPGLFEYPFMKRNTPERERLATLWTRYHGEGLGASLAGDPTPIMRVVPVGKSLSTQSRVMPYEEVAALIRAADYRAQGPCACRESVGRCDAPRDVCLFFGGPARGLVERGFAREVDADEAIAILDRAEQAGLVHTTNNSADRATVICSCCRCCCGILRGRAELDLPHAFAPSAWVAAVDAALCNACGVCAEERCPVCAIEAPNGAAVVDGGRCIGCGLCVTACPTDAVSLVPRDPIPAVPDSVAAMGLQVLAEKGKLDQFLAVMNRAK